MNRAWSAETGLPGPAALGWGWLEALHPDDRDDARAAYAQGVATGEPFRVSWRVRSAGGAWRRLGGEIQPTLRGWLGALAAEHLSGAHQGPLEAAFDALTEGVVVFDAAGRVVLVNEAEARLFGFGSAHEIAHDLDHFARVFELRAEDGRPLPVESWPVSRVLRGETLRDVVMEARRSDTGGRWDVRLGGAPVRDGAGQVALAVVVTRDVTRQESAERALRDRERRLRRVFDTNLLGVVYWDLSGRIRDANDEFLRIVGRTRADLASDRLDWASIMAPERLSAREARIEELRRAGVTPTAENEYVRGDGTRVWALARAALLDGDEAVAFLLDVTDRRQAQASLRASEERYRTLFESIEEGFAVLQMLRDETGRPVDYRFIEVNAHFAAHTGLEGALGRTAKEMVPELDAFWFETYGEVGRTGVPARFEYPSPAMGRWFEVYAWRTAGPEADQVALIFKDITERKGAEQKLRESESRAVAAAAEAEKERRLLDAVLEAAALGIIVVDASGAIVRANAASERLWGAAPPTANVADYDRWRAWWADGSERQGQRVRAEEWGLARALRGETAEGELVEIEPFDAPSTRRTVVNSAAPVRDATGAIVGAVAALVDVTRIVEAEAAAKRSEERYRLVSLATNEVIWDWDFRAGRIDWNQEAYRQLALTPEELGNSPESWAALIEPSDAQRVTAGLEAAVSGTGDSWHDEYRMRRSDGSYAMYTDRGYIARDAQGRATRMIGSMVDVSERRLVEQRAAQAQRLEALGRFAGGIAHDFNNLLTAVLGYAELLARKLDGTPQASQVARIREAAERGSGLTRQILAFARPQLGRQRIVDLDEVVLAADPILRRLLGSDIEIVTLLGGGLGPVRADPSQVEQILFNLVVNARDALPAGGKIRIETHDATLSPDEASDPSLRPGRWTRLTVSDNGVGMDADTLAHCFEPFYTTKDPDKGTGLGLATVWGIVDYAGGFVRVESAPGQGTRFDVYFPRAHPEPGEQQPVVDVARGEIRGGDETLLVVEDEPTLRELAGSTLSALGYRVLLAEEGAAAMAQVERLDGPLHAVVTDIVMPLMNGRELVRRLREQRPELRVLFVSGYTDQPLHEHEAFLAKPFTPSELARRVRALLDAER